MEDCRAMCCESPITDAHNAECIRGYSSKGCICGLAEARRNQGLCPECGTTSTACDDCAPRPEGEW